MTPLDRAREAHGQGPGFYDALAGAEVYLWLVSEPESGAIEPNLFETGQGTLAVAADTAERLTAFAEGPVAYAALSGRVLGAMLSGRGLGLVLNPGAPSEAMLDPDAVAWFAESLAGLPDEIEARPTRLSAPRGLPEVLLTALDAKLSGAEGLARMAYLAEAELETGGVSHLLAFVDAAPGAERALSAAVREALIFSGLEAGVLDVAFFAAADPITARLAKVGLRFDLPRFAPPEPQAPGRDPEKPPRLR